MDAPIYYPNAIQHKSPWQNVGSDYGRNWPYDVSLAVQHHTAGNEESVINTFSINSTRHVSAHLLIARSGKVHQFVPFSNIAWHAGKWDINVNSIGIEHEQSYINGQWQEWPDIQLETSAQVQNWLSQYMPEYDMEPHSKYQATDCPGNLPIDRIKELMQSNNLQDDLQWTDPATGIILLGGMYARWKQLLTMLGSEIYLVVGHPVSNEEKQEDGSIVQKFEHTTWRQRSGISPSRFDILADIINPFQ